MCAFDTQKRYPWAAGLLELHRVLPLASAPALSTVGTSLTDLVALCPTYHRNVHVCYRQWLTAHKRTDFAAKAEAIAVYMEAKACVDLS